MTVKYTPEQRIAAFWAKVDKSPGHGPKGECWPWTASTDDGGYGYTRVGERMERAHRIAYALANGPIPSNKPCVLHSCDNPPCCNPSHLWVGTRAENNADKLAKGRHVVASGGKHGRYTKPERTARGSRSGRSKLTEADIPPIREAVARKENKALLALRYGVSKSTIQFIADGRTWKHVLG